MFIRQSLACLCFDSRLIRLTVRFRNQSQLRKLRQVIAFFPHHMVRHQRIDPVQHLGGELHLFDLVQEGHKQLHLQIDLCVKPAKGGKILQAGPHVASHFNAFHIQLLKVFFELAAPLDPPLF